MSISITVIEISVIVDGTRRGEMQKEENDTCYQQMLTTCQPKLFLLLMQIKRPNVKDVHTDLRLYCANMLAN